MNADFFCREQPTKVRDPGNPDEERAPSGRRPLQDVCAVSHGAGIVLQPRRPVSKLSLQGVQHV